MNNSETARRIEGSYGLPAGELEGLFSESSRSCSGCKWYEDFNGVCCNGDSERCADYTDSDESCGEWEGKS